MYMNMQVCLPLWVEVILLLLLLLLRLLLLENPLPQVETKRLEIASRARARCARGHQAMRTARTPRRNGDLSKARLAKYYLKEI